MATAAASAAAPTAYGTTRARTGRSGTDRNHRRAGRPRQGLEVERQVVRRVEALLGILLEAVPHDAVEARRDVLVGRREVRRVLPQDGRHRLRRRLAVEGARARDHLVENGAEREDVRARIGLLSLDLLGRHVAERAEHDAGLGAVRGRQVRLRPGRAVGLRQLGEAEVEDLDPAVVGHEQVLGLQVPVNDPLLVRRRQPAGDLDRVVGGLAHRQRAAREPRAQRLAFEELRDDVRRTFERTELVDRRDVGVVEPAGGLGFLLEPAQAFGVQRERRGQHLDRDVALQALVARAVDLAHPSGAEEAEDLVRTELRSGGETQRDHRTFCPSFRGAKRRGIPRSTRRRVVRARDASLRSA